MSAVRYHHRVGTKLILIEGLPGSGKTTFARRTCEHFSALGMRATLSCEGDLDSADLAWLALIPFVDFQLLLDEYPEFKDALIKHSYRNDQHVVLAYHRCGIDDPTLSARLASYEIFGGRVSERRLSGLLRSSWNSISEQASSDDVVQVRECAFLQNYVCELMLFTQMEEDRIVERLDDLLDVILPMKPHIFYLSRPSIRRTLHEVSPDRTDELGNQVWLDSVLEYIESSPYGKHHDLRGMDGAVRFFEARKRVELGFLRQHSDVSSIIEADEYEDAWMQFQRILDQQLIPG
jgi:hypothetical protein